MSAFNGAALLYVLLIVAVIVWGRRPAPRPRMGGNPPVLCHRRGCVNEAVHLALSGQPECNEHPKERP